ncbi:MAG: hypothetical protein AAF206_02250 [Bacteroidota bacterium]
MHPYHRFFHHIFWGLLLVHIDYTYTETTYGYGFTIDYFPDIIGGALIFRAIQQIGRIHIRPDLLTRR